MDFSAKLSVRHFPSKYDETICTNPGENLTKQSLSDVNVYLRLKNTFIRIFGPNRHENDCCVGDFHYFCIVIQKTLSFT